MEALCAVSVQLVSTKMVKYLMVHGISWSGYTSGSQEGHEYNEFSKAILLKGELPTNYQPHVEILERTAARRFSLRIEQQLRSKQPTVRSQSGGLDAFPPLCRVC